MTKSEMIEYVCDSYVTDEDWKNLVLKDYGSFDNFAKSISKDEAVEMYHYCKQLEGSEVI